MSLLLPGAGHVYSGKRGTGIWTLGFFAAAVATPVLVAPATEIGLPSFVVLAFPIYVFAFLDAYWTTREANAGQDHLPNGNPRIAAMLNLMAAGLGYFYLGERKLGLVFFLLGRFIPAVALILVQIGIAVDAYNKCKRMYPPKHP